MRTLVHIRVCLFALGLLAFVTAASAATPLGTGFTYQGQLKQDGTPVNGTVDLQFSLWDAAGSGSPPVGGKQIGIAQTVLGVEVVNGLFTAELNAGGQFGASAFNGDERWLHIAVRSPAGGGLYTTLSPRQPLTPAPYAMYALSSPPWETSGNDIYYIGGSVGIGTLSPSYTLDVNGSGAFTGTVVFKAAQAFSVANSALIGNLNVDFLDGLHSTSFLATGTPAGGDLGGTYPGPDVVGLQGRSVSNAAPATGDALVWSGSSWGPGPLVFSLPYSGSTSTSGNAFQVANTGSGYAVAAFSSGSGGRAVFGSASASTGNNYGVYGQSASTGGRGVTGNATAASGVTFGVIGQSSSPDGTGVLGEATATTGANKGVYGTTSSSSGTGVRGSATASSGTTNGVWGLSTSPNGRGVFGEANATTGNAYGVHGQSTSISGIGVRGEASATSGVTTGVLGSAASTSGRGVVGEASGTTGSTVGVVGLSASTSGTGVIGNATASSGITYGVSGTVVSPNGHAIYGDATAATGNAYGVYGRSASTTGRGVAGEATATSGATFGVLGTSASKDGIGVLGSNTAGSGVAIGLAGSSTSPSGYGVQSSGNLRVFGDIIATGSKAGYVADIVMNGGEEPLETGDVVDIVGAADPIMGDIPVIVVRLTRTAESQAVLGPVDCALRLTEVGAREHETIARLQYKSRQFSVHKREGAIGPGEYGRVVTLGSFKAIKVDAGNGPVRPGDLLVSSSTPGFAMPVPRGSTAKTGTVIGKALAPLPAGQAAIPVLVQSR